MKVRRKPLPATAPEIPSLKGATPRLELVTARLAPLESPCARCGKDPGNPHRVYVYGDGTQRVECMEHEPEGPLFDTIVALVQNLYMLGVPANDALRVLSILNSCFRLHGYATELRLGGIALTQAGDCVAIAPHGRNGVLIKSTQGRRVVLP